MKDYKYPEDISDDERELGFGHFLIDGMSWYPAGTRDADIPSRVVAKILSPSDVLVKIYGAGGMVVYSHRRWGWSKTANEIDERRWHPVHVPLPDARSLLEAIDRQEMPELHPDDIVAFPFQYRAA